jgi:hypothetical protein
MKTHDLRDEHGRLIGFRVSNFLLGRHAVPKIVATIRGAKVVRKQPRFALSAPDNFCEFVVAGKVFLAVEPFGDNTEYWLLTEPPEECPQIETVRRAFEKHGLLGGSGSGP